MGLTPVMGLVVGHVGQHIRQPVLLRGAGKGVIVQDALQCRGVQPGDGGDQPFILRLPRGLERGEGGVQDGIEGRRVGDQSL